MSGPNDNYDPKQVAALSAEALEAMVADFSVLNTGPREVSITHR